MQTPHDSCRVVTGACAARAKDTPMFGETGRGCVVQRCLKKIVATSDLHDDAHVSRLQKQPGLRLGATIIFGIRIHDVVMLSEPPALSKRISYFRCLRFAAAATDSTLCQTALASGHTVWGEFPSCSRKY